MELDDTVPEDLGMDDAIAVAEEIMRYAPGMSYTLVCASKTRRAKKA
jgi:hypothetical protein